MRTAAQLKALGIDSWFHAHTNHFVHLLEKAGWSDKQIDHAAIAVGLNFRGGTDAELMQAMREAGEYVNAPELSLVIDACMGLRDQIITSGVESLPALPKPEAFTPAHAARTAQIRDISRTDPHAYNSSPAIQAEHLALIEASLPPAGDTQ